MCLSTRHRSSPRQTTTDKSRDTPFGGDHLFRVETAWFADFRRGLTVPRGSGSVIVRIGIWEVDGPGFSSTCRGLGHAVSVETRHDRKKQNAAVMVKTAIEKYCGRANEDVLSNREPKWLVVATRHLGLCFV